MTVKQIQFLVSKAEDALKRSVSPYSGFRVGAAVMSRGGRLYTGSNIENPSLMLSMCAERTALYKGVTGVNDPFVAIAIVSGAGDYCFPCGACRQLLYEFAPGIDVYLKSKKGIKKFSIGELLPYPFRTPVP